jgi:hypothetical protein
MAVIVGARATATALRQALGSSAQPSPASPPTTVQVYGLPGMSSAPGRPATGPDAHPMPCPRAPSTSPAFIANLPDAQGLRWLDEHNTAGAGSIDYRRYDAVEAEHPNLWTAGNQIMIAVGGIDVFRLILDSEGGYRIDADTGDRTDSWPGTGPSGSSTPACAPPSTGIGARGHRRPDLRLRVQPEHRRLVRLLGVAQADRPAAPQVVALDLQEAAPAQGLRDKKAQWLWYRDPDSKNSANETCYFSDSFTLRTARRVKIWAAGDDTLEFQLDGEVQITTGPGGWRGLEGRAEPLRRHALGRREGLEHPGSTATRTGPGSSARSPAWTATATSSAWLLAPPRGTWKIRRQLSARRAGSPHRSCASWSGAAGPRLRRPQRRHVRVRHRPRLLGVPWVGRQEIDHHRRHPGAGLHPAARRDRHRRRDDTPRPPSPR